MCTVSWIHQDDGYQVFCNRDERLRRRPALAPRLMRREGVCFLAPRDGEFGGTWIATNEFGISVCLLNGQSGSGVRSRGLLVPELMSAGSLRDVNERVWRQDLSAYAAFTLAVFEPGQQTTVIEWDGREKFVLPYGEPHMPLVSSSFDPESVRGGRRALLDRMTDGAGISHPGALLMFHRSHRPARGPYSPCMHRADAETVSFTWVTVTATEASLYYSAGSPCQSFSGESVSLALRQEEAVAC